MAKLQGNKSISILDAAAKGKYGVVAVVVVRLVSCIRDLIS